MASVTLRNAKGMGGQRYKCLPCYQEETGEDMLYLVTKCYGVEVGGRGGGVKICP